MIKNNSELDLANWIDEYGSFVLATAYRLLKNKQDAEDIFQNTFIKAYSKTMPFKNEEHTKAWLIRTATNNCISYLRSGWKSRVHLIDIPDEFYEYSSTKNDILSVINNMSIKYKRAIYLHYFCGYSSKEIAIIEKVSSSAIRSRLERARAKLKIELERNK